jgi:RecA/RadA recombinase
MKSSDENKIDTLVAETIGNVQACGGIAALIVRPGGDLSTHTLKEYGVVLEDLLVSQPKDAEEAGEMAKMLIKANAVSVFYV